MVASQGDQLRPTDDAGCRLVLAQLLKCLCHLLPGDIVVERCDWNIAAVDDLCPALVWIDASPRIEATKGRLSACHVSNRARTKPGTRSVAHTRVERCPNNGDIEGLIRARETLLMLKMSKCANTREPPLVRLKAVALVVKSASPLPSDFRRMTRTHILTPFAFEGLEFLVCPPL